MVRELRAISPVIATVIILAVTIAIAIAVVGWVTGLFRSASKTGAQLEIMPDSYINTTANVTCIHVRNMGTSETTIDKIVISGLGTVSRGDFNATPVLKPGDTLIYIIINNTDPSKIPARACADISAANKLYAAKDFKTIVSPGVTYGVEILTVDGLSYSGTVYSRSG